MKLTEHFKLAEFLSPRDPIKPDKKIVDSLTKLCTALEELRRLAGVPLKITSGYRSPDYNKKIGGAPGSEHCGGIACDLATDDQLKLAAKASTIAAIGAIGLYPEDGIIHVDIRPRVKGKITWWVRKGAKYLPLDASTRVKLIDLGAKGLT